MSRQMARRRGIAPSSGPTLAGSIGSAKFMATYFRDYLQLLTTINASAVQLDGATRQTGALSQHLALLREDGVVATRRDGQTIFYRIANPAADTCSERFSQTAAKPVF